MKWFICSVLTLSLAEVMTVRFMKSLVRGWKSTSTWYEIYAVPMIECIQCLFRRTRRYVPAETSARVWSSLVSSVRAVNDDA